MAPKRLSFRPPTMVISYSNSSRTTAISASNWRHMALKRWPFRPRTHDILDALMTAVLFSKSSSGWMKSSWKWCQNEIPPNTALFDEIHKLVTWSKIHNLSDEIHDSIDKYTLYLMVGWCKSGYGIVDKSKRPNYLVNCLRFSVKMAINRVPRLSSIRSRETSLYGMPGQISRKLSLDISRRQSIGTFCTSILINWVAKSYCLEKSSKIAMIKTYDLASRLVPFCK